MKLLHILLFVLMTSFLLAQKPSGYLGKRYLLEANFNMVTASEFPNWKNRSAFGYNNSEVGLFPINLSYRFALQKVYGKKKMFGFDYGYYKTGINIYGEFQHINVHTIGIKHSSIFMKNIAPLGGYFGIGAGLIFAKMTEVNVSSPTIVNFSPFPYLSMEFGDRIALSERLLLNLGVVLRGSYYISDPESTVFERILRHDAINFNIGLAFTL